MADEKITIDGLAGMVKRGFDKTDERFDKIDERLERIEMKLEGIVYHREFDELKGRVETLENLLEVKKKT